MDLHTLPTCKRNCMFTQEQEVSGISLHQDTRDSDPGNVAAATTVFGMLPEGGGEPWTVHACVPQVQESWVRVLPRSSVLYPLSRSSQVR